jgi:hypothetical protein
MSKPKSKFSDPKRERVSAARALRLLSDKLDPPIGKFTDVTHCRDCENYVQGDSSRGYSECTGPIENGVPLDGSGYCHAAKQKAAKELGT